MITLTIVEEATNKSRMVDILRRIADLIENGYTSGYDPTWEIEGEEEPENEE